MNINWCGLWVVALLCVMPLSAIADEKSVTFESLYDALLRHHVTEGVIESVTVNVVDYEAWKNDSRYAQAKTALVTAKPGKTDETKKIFWINVYNFLVIDMVISHNVQYALSELSGPDIEESPFKTYSIKVAGLDVSLAKLEEKILPGLKDPFILLALCNSDIYAPDIQAEAYRPERFKAQMKEQVRNFLQDSERGVRIEGDGLIISPLFAHYESWFGSGENVLAFIQEHDDRVKPKMEIRGYLLYLPLLNSKRHDKLSPDKPDYTPPGYRFTEPYPVPIR